MFEWVRCDWCTLLHTWLTSWDLLQCVHQVVASQSASHALASRSASTLVIGLSRPSRFPNTD